MLNGHTRNWLCLIAFDCRSKLDQRSDVLLLCLVNAFHRIKPAVHSLLLQKNPSLPQESRFLVSVSGVAGMYGQAR